MPIGKSPLTGNFSSFCLRSLFTLFPDHQDICSRENEKFTMSLKREMENQKYTEDAESLLSPSDLKEHGERIYMKTNRWPAIRHAILLGFTHLLVAGTAIWLWTYREPDLDSKCSFHTSHYCECPLPKFDLQTCADLLQLRY